MKYKKEILWKLVVLVMILALAVMIKTSLTPPPETDAWTDIGGPARSPSWWAEHCDYIEIDPLDESPVLPDGIYVNCQ